MTEEDAIGNPLPQIEEDAHRVINWDDRRRATCWAAMPLDTSLRMDGMEVRDEKLRSRWPDETLFSRAALNAPPELQFRDLGPETRIALTGFSAESLDLELPPPPYDVRVEAGSRSRAFVPALQSIELLPNHREVSLVYRCRFTAPLIRGQARRAAISPRVPRAWLEASA